MKGRLLCCWIVVFCNRIYFNKYFVYNLCIVILELSMFDVDVVDVIKSEYKGILIKLVVYLGY